MQHLLVSALELAVITRERNAYRTVFDNSPSCAGKAKYDSKKHALVWKIKKFTGATEHSLVSAVELIATTREKKSWSRPPISMTFQVGLLAHQALRQTSHLNFTA